MLVSLLYLAYCLLYTGLLSTVCCLLDYGANKSALPAVLAHSGAIEIPAMVMSIIGGLLIYGTIISFSMFFQEQEEF